MTQRTKLDLELNLPTEIELLYDECVSGKNQYGDYFLYAVKHNGQEWSYFPPEQVHQGIKDLRRGDKAVITKMAAQRGSKIVTSYDIQTSVRKEPVIISSEKSNIPEEPVSLVESEQSIPGDKFYDTMLQSYRDAINIQKELNGMADPERIAITIFIARSKSNGY